MDEHCREISANDLTGPQKKDIFSVIKEKGTDSLKQEISTIVPNCVNDDEVKETPNDKDLLAAEVPESRDTINKKQVDLSSSFAVGNTYPHFVRKSANAQKRRNNGNRKRQFQKGSIVKIQGKTYRVVKVVDQPPANNNQKRRQFQRQPNNRKQQVAGKKNLQQRRQPQQQLWNNDNTK